MTPMPKDVEIEFYHIIGGIIIRYGFIDALVANICRTLFEDLGGHPSQKKAFRPMGVRLEYMGKCFRNKPELSEMTEDAEFLRERIGEMDEMRNFLVHGCLTEYFPEPRAYRFTKVDMSGDKSGFEQNSVRIPHAELLNIAQACTYAVRGLNPIAKRLEVLASARKG